MFDILFHINKKGIEIMFKNYLITNYSIKYN